MIISLLIISLVLLILHINNKLETKGLNEELAIAFKRINRNKERLIKLEEQCNVAYVELYDISKNIKKQMEIQNTKKIVYYAGNNILLEGQYVVYTGGTWDSLWHDELPAFPRFFEIVRKTKSWKDVVESCKNNTFAGVVKKQTQCPSLVEIYVSNETKANQQQD